MFDEQHPGASGAVGRIAGDPGQRDAATGVRDVTGDPADQQDDPLPFLIADADPAALGRTVLAVAAMHEPDEDGRCRVCSPRSRWRRPRDEQWCSTRRVLWATLVEGHQNGTG